MRLDGLRVMRGKRAWDKICSWPSRSEIELGPEVAERSGDGGLERHSKSNSKSEKPSWPKDVTSMVDSRLRSIEVDRGGGGI